MYDSYSTAYRSRPVRVEAVEWQLERFQTKPLPSMPNWFCGAVMQSYRHRLYGKIQIVGENLQVDTGNGGIVAKPGDFIVYWNGSDHHLSVHSPEEFGRLFDELHERPPRLRSTTEAARPARAKDEPK